MSIKIQGDHVHSTTGLRHHFTVAFEVRSDSEVGIVSGEVRQGGKTWPLELRTLVAAHGDANVMAPKMVVDAVHYSIDSDAYLNP